VCISVCVCLNVYRSMRVRVCVCVCVCGNGLDRFAKEAAVRTENYPARYFRVRVEPIWHTGLSRSTYRSHSVCVGV